MNKKTAIISAVLASGPFIALSLALDAAAPERKPLSDEQRYLLLTRYQKAMSIQAQLQQAVAQYQEAQKKVLQDDGYPEICAGTKTSDCTNITLDVNAEQVNLTVVPKPAKPAEKAPAK